MRNDAKLQRIEEIFIELKRNDDNINGIGYGKKTINGIETDVDAIVIAVNKKLSVEQLDKQKLIAKKLSFNGVEVLTDVVEATVTRLSRCYGADAENTDLPPSTSPIYYNRADILFLSGGCNFAKWTPAVDAPFCTLGGIFKDNIDGSYVALTNTHCLDRAREVYLTFTGNPTPVLQTYYIPLLHPITVKEYGGGELIYYNQSGVGYARTTNWADTVLNNTFVNTNYYQPSRKATTDIPTTDVLSGTKAFGFFKRATPYIHYRDPDNVNFNYTDAALIGVTNKINPTSKTFIGFQEQPATIRFANDTEIDRLTNTTPLFYSGSRSGPVGFPGNSNSCTLKLLKLYGISEIKEQLPAPIFDATLGSYFQYIFSDCIEFEINSPHTIALEGGDSGSILWAKFSLGGWKIIGLNFAGLTYKNSAGATIKQTGLACRITNVAKALNISPWNGETLNTSKPMYEVLLPSELPINKLINNRNTLINSITGDDGKVYYYCGTQQTTAYNDIKFTI